MRILFALRFRDGRWGQSGSELSSGLKNSVTFLVDMLNAMGHVAKMVQLADHNKIDAAIALFRPDLVILEALSVLPGKLDDLIPRWPQVKWALRNHSDIPFIANEGVAMDWLDGYWKRGVYVISNDPIAMRDIQIIAWSYGRDEYADLNLYGPNYYPLTIHMPRPTAHHDDGIVNVGCFGAIRPLKNQLIQAVSALQFARQRHKHLRFHINAARIEQVGEPILRNLRSLLMNAGRAELLEHPWLDHVPFLNLMAEMDYAMCVSMSETFCIVAADAVASGVPVIGSPQIPWLPQFAQADPCDTEQMTRQLTKAELLRHEWRVQQWTSLRGYNCKTQMAWNQLLHALR